MHNTGSQRILRTNNEESAFVDHLSKDIRAKTKMVHRRLDVCPNRLSHQVAPLLPRVKLPQQGPDKINHRVEMRRTTLCRTFCMLQGDLDSAAIRVPQYHHQARVETLCCKLDATDLRRGNDIARHTHNKQIAQALIKDDFRWHARVRTVENNGNRLLACDRLAAACLVGECTAIRNARYKTVIAGLQVRQCTLCGDH